MKCLRLHFCLLPVLLCQAAAALQCPPDWLPYGRYCYGAIYGPGKTFAEARAACQEVGFGSDLLWLETQEELNWAVETGRFRIREKWVECGSACGAFAYSGWVGMLPAGANPNGTRAMNSEWVWLRDGKPVRLAFTWYFGHPRPSPEDFVSVTELQASPYRFRSEARSTRMFPICKMDPDASKGPCPTEDWLQFGGFCYLLVKGASGRTLSEAVSDCQSRDRAAHLLWVSSQAEMDWLTDYSARNWRLREDYRAQCQDCRFQGDAAWTGLYRDVADGGKFKWLRDNSSVTVDLPWLIAPSQPPSNFGFLFDASPELLWRTYQPEARHFHLCKAPGRSSQPVLHQGPPGARDAVAGHRCPSGRWLWDAEAAACVPTVRARSLRLARAECRRRLSGSEPLGVSAVATAERGGGRALNRGLTDNDHGAPTSLTKLFICRADSSASGSRRLSDTVSENRGGQTVVGESTAGSPLLLLLVLLLACLACLLVVIWRKRSRFRSSALRSA